MTPMQLFFISWARRKLVLVVFLLIVSAATIVSFLLPKQYSASTSLVFDVKTDPIAGVVLPSMSTAGYMATQTDIIASERVLTRAVKLLRLENNVTAQSNWKDATGGKIPFEIYYAQLLARGLGISPSRGSNVLTLAFGARDPQFAAAVANAIAQAYIDINIELRVEPARQYAAWFDERLKTLRSNLEQAQRKLSAYQQEQGIVATDDRLDQETARLASLSTQLAEAEGQRADATSRQKGAGGELSPDVLKDSLIQSLKAEVAKSEAKLSEISKNVGQNHPVRQQLEAQIGGLRYQLSEEMKRISGGVVAAGRVSAQKEEELKAAMDAQKKRVLELRAQRDTISILQRDVESAQRTYDAVTQRMNQTNLESQAQQTNVSILSPAIEPTEPDKPKILKIIIASIAAGIAAGIGLAVGLELLDRRVRNADDLAALEGIPFLGVLQPESRRYSFVEMVELGRAYLKQWRKRSGWRLKRSVPLEARQ